MLGHPDQRVAQAIEVLGGGRPVHPLDGANRRGTGRSNSAPTATVAPEGPRFSRREEIVGPEALGESRRRQDLDAVVGPPRTLIQAHDDSFADPGMVCRQRSQALHMIWRLTAHCSIIRLSHLVWGAASLVFARRKP